MTRRNLLLAFLAVVFICACRKHNDGDTNPNDNNPLQVDELVLYTSNGANHDQQMIKNFITRNFPEVVNRFYYGQSTVTNHDINASLVFVDNNKVKLNGTTMEIVRKTDTEMLVSPMDSTDMPARDPLGHCMLLHQQVPQYNPYSICSTGNCKKYRKVYPVIISGGDYYLPIINYAVVSNCNVFKYTNPPMPNYFNKEITNGLLFSKDSVVVQTAKLKAGK
jgi:hypothetical protein